MSDRNCAITSEKVVIDPAQKAKWLTALRSGEYEQCRDMLYDPDLGGFCCMGVLAVINGKTKEEIEGRCLIRKEAEGWLDPDASPDKDMHYVQATLERMNDDGKSFTEIADYIEKNL